MANRPITIVRESSASSNNHRPRTVEQTVDQIKSNQNLFIAEERTHIISNTIEKKDKENL